MEDDEVNWKEHFPIYQTEDFDLSFPNLLVPLGLKSTTPKELIKRIIAAAISYHAQYRSIDYAFKKYVQWREYDTNDGSRLDVRISRAIGEGSDQFHSLIYHVATLPPKSLGNVISELTLMRVPHAIRQLLTLAHRGCLYEACAVGRMILEQIAWAANIDSLRDKESIISKKAEDSISYLKRIIPSAGRLYGWLSTHTHWRYDGHVKALNLSSDSMGMILQSSRFKAVSLLVGLLLFASLVVTFTSLREAEVLELLRMKPEERLKFDKTVDDLVSFQDAMMTERRGETVAEIRALVGLSLPLSLIAEIRNLAQNDEDIAHLSSMASELKL